MVSCDFSLRLRHPSSWNNVALNASRTVFNSHGPYCNSSETVWQSFNCFILERGYYNRVLNVYDEVLLFITEHKVAEKWLKRKWASESIDITYGPLA